MGPEAAGIAPTFMPMFIMSLPFAVGNFLLAPRLGGNSFVYAILTLIPVLNFFFVVYVWYKIIFRLLDARKPD